VLWEEHTAFCQKLNKDAVGVKLLNLTIKTKKVPSKSRETVPLIDASLTCDFTGRILKDKLDVMHPVA
jgi:hypothetical protein